MSELYTALGIAMEAQGALRIAIADARTGDIVMERGEKEEFGKGLLVGLHEEFFGTVPRGPYTAHRPQRPDLRDIILHFDTRCHIIRPVLKACGPGDLYLHLVLERASANIPAAQAKLTAVLAQLASLRHGIPELLALPDEIGPEMAFNFGKELDITPELSKAEIEKESLPPFLFDPDVLKLLGVDDSK